MNEVMTMVEAEVTNDKWEALQQAYQSETADLPEYVKQTFLVQSQSRQTTWRIVTHWRSQADLDHMRATVAVRVFHAAGAIPHLEIWNVAAHQIGQGLQQ